MPSLIGRRILVIDDSLPQLLLIKKILETDGAQVFITQSAIEGLKFIIKQSPHLVFCDLKMPGMDGFEFLQKKTSTKRLEQIPTVVLTSASDKESVQKALGFGVLEYVLKPIDTMTFLQKIRKILNLNSFLHKEFKPGFEPKAKISLSSTLTKINETGTLLESPIKIACDEVIEIETKFLNRV